MSLDRDLHDAMRSLGGDPVADAQAVLAALPVQHRKPPTGKSPKQLPWWWIAAAALLALGIGIGVGRWSLGGPQANEPAKRPEASAGGPRVEGGAIDPPKGEVPPAKPPDLGPSDLPAVLHIMAFGELDIDEPGEGRQRLKPGPYEVAVGTSFTTVEDELGVYVVQNDLRVRLDRATVATVQQEKLVVKQGRLWCSNIARPFELALQTRFGRVQASNAEIMVEVSADQMLVSCLAGVAVVRAEAGSPLQLRAPQHVEVDARTGPSRVQEITFPGSVTGWMTQMILLQQDDMELRERIASMVDAYVGGTHRAAAAVELRRIGAPATTSLFYSLDTLAAEPEVQHATVALLADIADYLHKDSLLAILEQKDAASRVLAFRGLVRILGSGAESEAFWRDEAETARAAALAAWRVRLR